MKCEACEHEWEVVQSIVSPLPTVCEKCGADEGVHQIIRPTYKLKFTEPWRTAKERMK